MSLERHLVNVGRERPRWCRRRETDVSLTSLERERHLVDVASPPLKFSSLKPTDVGRILQTTNTVRFSHYCKVSNTFLKTKLPKLQKVVRAVKKVFSLESICLCACWRKSGGRRLKSAALKELGEKHTHTYIHPHTCSWQSKVTSNSQIMTKT
jgi:hypothetical protein